MHISARILLCHTHTFIFTRKLARDYNISHCKYDKLWKFLSESLLMEWQNSSSMVGQQLRCLLEKFSKKYLADQTRSTIQTTNKTELNISNVWRNEKGTKFSKGTSKLQKDKRAVGYPCSNMFFEIFYFLKEECVQMLDPQSVRIRACSKMKPESFCWNFLYIFICNSSHIFEFRSCMFRQDAFTPKYIMLFVLFCIIGIVIENK